MGADLPLPQAVDGCPRRRRVPVKGTALPRHFVALDSLRGIAALMVALHHFRTVSPLDGLAVVRQAWLFVDFFFLLSGFVIAANYRDRLARGHGISSFMLLRIGRLYPLHLAVLSAFVVAECAFLIAGPNIGGAGRAAFTGQTDPWTLPSNLLLLSGLGLHEGLTWNGVAWSVSTEMWTYLVYALVVSLLAVRARLSGLVLAVIGFVVIVMAVAQPESFGRFAGIGRCLHGFGMGCLLFEAYQAITAWRGGKAPHPSGPVLTAMECGAIALAAFPFLVVGILPPHLLTAAAFAPAVLVFAFDGGRISALLQVRALTALGLLSYSIYMIHPFVQARLMLPAALLLQNRLALPLVSRRVIDGETVQVWGSGAASGLALTAVMVVLVVLFSILGYRWIEVPGRAAMRRHVEAARTVATARSARA